VTLAAAETATLAAPTESAAATAAAEATTLAATESATAAAEAAASRTLFLRTGFIDSQLTTVEFNAIYLFSSDFCLFSSAHGHKRETARTSGHAIKGDINIGYGSELLELST
jgi:hypothetical protein